MGGADFAASALAAGVTEPGEACLMLGTAGNLIAVTSAKDLDPRLINAHAVGGDRRLALGATLCGAVPGVAPPRVRARRGLCPARRGGGGRPRRRRGAADAPVPGGERTPVWDAAARGALVGLTLAHGRAHLYRAALEGVAVSFRHCLEVLREGDNPIREVIAVDGGARSPLWRQILCDALGVPLAHLADSRGAPAGGAILAGMGTGVLEGVAAARRWRSRSRSLERHEPDRRAARPMPRSSPSASTCTIGCAGRLMARISILGAGFMGSALCVPAADNGHAVSLWGTELDAHLIAAVRARTAHPKLGMALPRSVSPFRAGELEAALAGADLVINAVTSDAAVSVVGRAARFIPKTTPVLSVSKGLVPRRGRVTTLSLAIAEATGIGIVTVAGPSKAMELARRVPTAVVYASPAARPRRAAREWLETPYYRVDESADQRGTELASALKNAYAIAIGLCDGLVKARRAAAMYNTKSLLYTQALVEMRRLGRVLRARPGTVDGLAGAGDLHVTAGRGPQPHLRRAARLRPQDGGGGGDPRGPRPAHRGVCRHPLVLAVRRPARGGRGSAAARAPPHRVREQGRRHRAPRRLPPPGSRASGALTDATTTHQQRRSQCCEVSSRSCSAAC